MRVVAERPSRGCLPGALQPASLVLVGLRVRGTHQRCDAEAARRARLQRREARPAGVVERPLDVAGHDGAGLHAANQTRSSTWTRPRVWPAPGGTAATVTRHVR